MNFQHEEQVFKSKGHVFKYVMYFKNKMQLNPVHIVDMNKTIPDPEMEKKIIGALSFHKLHLGVGSWSKNLLLFTKSTQSVYVRVCPCPTFI